MSQIQSGTKQEWRHILRQALQRLTPEELQSGSDAICARLLQQSFWRESRVISFYAATGREPNLDPLMQQAFKDGRTVVLPRYDVRQGSYHWATIKDLESDMVPGLHGVREPRSECPRHDPLFIDLILVPGLGFSPEGVRLGRGQGYYDRLLAASRGCRCGIALDCQVVLAVPMEPHDMLVQHIVTPTRCVSCTPRRTNS